MAVRKVHNKKKSNNKNKHTSKHLRKSKHNKSRSQHATRKNKKHGKHGKHVKHGKKHQKGGNASPLVGKPWDAETGGTHHTVNKEIVSNQESARFSHLDTVHSVYPTRNGSDRVVKDLPKGSDMKGGSRRKLKNKRHLRSRKHHKKNRAMKGGSPSCVTTGKASASKLGFSDFVPQAAKDLYRGGIDAIENTSNAFAGKPPIADDSNYSNQPIAHDSAKIGSHVNVPPNVGRIMDISRIEAGRL